MNISDNKANFAKRMKGFFIVHIEYKWYFSFHQMQLGDVTRENKHSLWE